MSAARGIKRTLTRLPVTAPLWASWRRRQFLAEYRARRERYAAAATARGLVYDPHASALAVRARNASRGYDRSPAPGDVHTLAFVPRLGWHTVLIDELRRLGPVSLFDYTELGITWLQLYQGDAAARRRLNDAFLEYARRVTADRAVDWTYVYAAATEIAPETVTQVQELTRAPVVGMCLDDKNSWDGKPLNGYHARQRDLAPVLDLAWTSARVTCEWYLVEGGRPLYLPEGFSPEVFQPMDVAQDIDVSFVGQAYGFRPGFVNTLRRAGIDVKAFGEGWPAGSISFADYTRLLSRSRINLGHGGIGYAEEITNVKARDFEIPGAGGGLYLTTFNADLAQHFVVGEELACYRDVDEAVELIRYYLRHADEARAMAARAYERCVREHTWHARFQTILRTVGAVQ